MADRSDDAGSSHPQETRHVRTEPIETPESNKQIDNSAVELPEEIDLEPALENSEIGRIEEILRSRPSFTNKPSVGKFKDTPLQFAIRWGKKDVAECLLKHPGINISVNLQDRDGFLPFHRALYNGRWEEEDIFDALIKRMSEDGLRSRTEKGDTVLHFASRRQRPDVVEMLCKCPILLEGFIDAKNKAGLEAIYEGIENWDVVRCLLRYRGSYVITDYGDTLLYLAVTPRTLDSPHGFRTRWGLLAMGVDLGA